VKIVIDNLPKGKATGEDNIPAELLQCMGESGLQIMTKLINKIYNVGYIPDDFRKSIFIPIPKTTKALDCSDYRTIALISHASKILFQLIKKIITPIIERQLSESQMGFRKGKGTRDAIFQLRMIGERTLKMGRKLCVCFVDYQKAFDRVKHDKLSEGYDGKSRDSGTRNEINYRFILESACICQSRGREQQIIQYQKRCATGLHNFADSFQTSIVSS